MRSRQLLLHCCRLAALGYLAACGAGESVSPPPPPPPPPAPVVATVEVSPATRALIVDDTLRLRAVARTAAGTEVSGRVVTWQSGTATVASVSAEGLVTALSAGQATITATVDGRSGTAQLTVADIRVSVDSVSATTASVGPTGGTIAATASGGLVYQLSVPAGALDSSVAITVTPVTRIRRVSAAGGVVGGVEFKPSGLRFNLPARLTIKKAPTVPANMKLVGMNWTGDGDSLRLQPARLTGGEVVVLVSHFSGAGALVGTTADLSQFTPPTGNAQSAAENALATLQHPADLAQMVTVFETWAAAIHADALAANTDTKALTVLDEFIDWHLTVDLLDSDPVAPNSLTLALEATERNLIPIVAGAVAVGIESANLACQSARSLVAVRNVLTLLSRVLAFTGIDFQLVDPRLAETTVLTGLCISIEVTQQALPDPLSPNTAANLQLRFGFAFTNTPTQIENTVFQIGIVAVGSTNDGTRQLTSDDQGQATTAVAATGASQLRLKVTGCIHPATLTIPGRTYSADRPGLICRQLTITRNFGITVGPTTINSDAGLASLANVAVVDGNLIIEGPQVTVSNLQALSNLAEVRGVLVLRQLPNLTSTAGLDGLTVLGGLSLDRLPLLQRPLLPNGVSSIPGYLSILTTPVNDLGGLRGMSSIGTLAIQNAPIADLGPLGSPQVHGLVLQNLPNLHSLGSIALGSQVNILWLMDLPALTGTGPLMTITDVFGDVVVNGSHATLLLGLPLRVVTGALMVNLPSQAGQYRIPTLTTLGRWFLIIPVCAGPPATVTFDLPALTSVRDIFALPPGSTSCRLVATAPNAAVTQIVTIGRGIQSVALKSMSGVKFQIRGATDLTSFSIGPVSVSGDLEIENNPVLSAITISGQVGGNMVVRNNPLLSNRAIENWNVTVGGNKTISNNGTP